MKIKFYIKKNNSNPVLNFINKLEKSDQAKLLGCLKSMEELGLKCPRVKLRQIKDKLWEIKIKAIGGGYRIFYALFRDEILILLHAFKKQTKKTPQKEINKAMNRLKEVIENENDYS